MPETTKSNRSGPPVNKALGSEEPSGSMAASEANTNTNSATAEPSRMANPLKARKRTKTGCLSKFRSSWRTIILKSITHTPQHAASGASSAAKSARPVKIVSNQSASAKAIFLESFSRTLLALSGQRSKELLLALNIPMLMELQAPMGAFLQHPWILQLRRVSFRMGSKRGLDACLRQVDPWHQETSMPLLATRMLFPHILEVRVPRKCFMHHNWAIHIVFSQTTP